MRRHANVAVVVATALVGALAPWPASGQSRPGGTGTTTGAQESAQPRLWSVSAVAASVFESNIDRTQGGGEAGGLVLGLGGQYQNRADRPTFTVQYQAGGHMYANAPRWTRISHNARAAYERRLFRPLTLETVGEMSIRGSTEDRELGNQYTISPRLQYRLSRTFRVELESGYRVKHYEDRARNATNPYGGVSLTQRVGRGKWVLGYRYEENHAETERNRYIRSKYSVEVVAPATRRDTVGVELKVRSRRYERLVRVGDSRVPLRDRKWNLSPEWVRVLSPRLQLRASYEFETRGANDPDRPYSAHSMVVAIERRW